MAESLRMFYFVAYTIIWELFIWFGSFYIILTYEWSAWLILLTVFLAATQFQPRHFGIDTKDKKVESMDEGEFQRWERKEELEIRRLEATK